jgi:hypothetical protein
MPADPYFARAIEAKTSAQHKAAASRDLFAREWKFWEPISLARRHRPARHPFNKRILYPRF